MGFEEVRFLLGNEAIGRALVEAGCEVACAYPGTPSSEIIPSVEAFAEELGTKTEVEWSVNEKVAFEVALGAAMSGKRSATAMKHVGLNVAADPLMSAAQFELSGGMIVVAADDPGHHSSQNEQDSRFFAMFAKVPCFDPCSAQEAMEMVFHAYELSERHRTMVVLRPTIRVCHARQSVRVGAPRGFRREAHFEKDPSRWVCVPAHVGRMQRNLNQRIRAIREEFEGSPFNLERRARRDEGLGIIASGICFSNVMDLIELNGWDNVSVLKIGTPYPLPQRLVEDFVSRHRKVLVLEETYPVVELQLLERKRVMGRWNGFVPEQDELTPEVLEAIVCEAFSLRPSGSRESASLRRAVEELGIKPRRPVFCPGCPHRATMYAIKRAFPRGVYPSDIGCYSLGINQKAVDSIVCMGASSTVPSGIFLAHQVDGKEIPIIATVGDSTFFHMGIPGLINAVYNRHPYVLVVMDNSTTAMTGNQPTPASGVKPRGKQGGCVSLEAVISGIGVAHLEVVDAYDVRGTMRALKEAHERAREKGLPAVVISRHPCMLILRREDRRELPVRVDQDRCVGCRNCVDAFYCPGIAFDEARRKAYVDERFCVSCGVCEAVCPAGAIQVERGEA